MHNSRTMARKVAIRRRARSSERNLKTVWRRGLDSNRWFRSLARIRDFLAQSRDFFYLSNFGEKSRKPGCNSGASQSIAIIPARPPYLNRIVFSGRRLLFRDGY
jgi:hypothetical protein